MEPRDYLTSLEHPVCKVQWQGHAATSILATMVMQTCHTRKEFGHELVVQSLATIEDHALQPKRLSQVFDRFSLASASRACWGAPQMHAEGPGQGHVAAVCHGGDHQAGLCTQVLIPIHKAGIHLHRQGMGPTRESCRGIIAGVTLRVIQGGRQRDAKRVTKQGTKWQSGGLTQRG